MPRFLRAALFAALFGHLAAYAAPDLQSCAPIKHDAARLKCYDALAGRAAEPTPGPAGPGVLADEWWLDESNMRFTDLRSHRPVYVIARWTSELSPQPAGTARAEDLNPTELKFQLSFRNELVSPAQFRALASDRLRLWFAYTQQANWQAFNTRHSRPFRDTNYEPELILTYDNRPAPGSGEPGGLQPTLVNLGLSHQSNGRSSPESRTWWRLYLQGGWQLGGGSLLARAWRTLDESGMRIDNPDINDYVGRAELVYRTRETSLGHFSFLARNSLRSRPNRGFYQLDWKSSGRALLAPLHVQISTGYGESLLDYNHRQTTVGVGFSFWDW
jgi:phospholipase A1/A2